jgi:hypothetical protein
VNVGDLVAFEGLFNAKNLAIITAVLPSGGVMAWFGHDHEVWYSAGDLGGGLVWEIVSNLS